MHMCHARGVVCGAGLGLCSISLLPMTPPPPSPPSSKSDTPCCHNPPNYRNGNKLPMMCYLWWGLPPCTIGR